MVVSQFFIELDNPEAVYLAGQSVSGQLVFGVTANTETFKSIHLECKGITKVSFQQKTYQTEKDFFGDNILVTKTMCYKVSKVHFKSSLPMLTATDDRLLKFKVAYQYIFPFYFTLPNSIPSSVEGEYGRIRYVLSGHLKRTDKMKKKKGDEYCRMNITFNNLVDLNLNPVAKMPASGTKSKNICHWYCFGRGPVTAQAWINQSGYAPGQILYFNASVENLSGKTMKGSTVQLIQEIEYFAKEEQEEGIRVILDSSHGAFGPSDIWDNVPFLIPYLAPSDERLSQHIKIRYRIEFTIHPGSCKGSKFTIPLRVIIGNIPVNSTVVPSGIPSEIQESAITVPSSQDAPPRYEECFSAGSYVTDDDGAVTSGVTLRHVTFARAADVDDDPSLAD